MSQRKIKSKAISSDDSSSESEGENQEIENGSDEENESENNESGPKESEVRESEQENSDSEKEELDQGESNEEKEKKTKGEIDIFPDYRVDPDGRVFSLLTKKFISSSERGGYRYFSLVRVQDGKRKRTTIGQHVLLAMAYIPNPKNEPIVIHINKNGLDNSLENLRWGTRKDIQTFPSGGHRGRAVLQYTLDGELVKRYSTVLSAAEAMGCNENTINKVCMHKPGKKTAKGYRWEYETKKKKPRKIEGEKWKTHPDFPLHKISSHGRVYSVKTKTLLSQVDRLDGYVRVDIQHKKHYVHCLMATAFFGPPPSNIIRPMVNHKDGNKSNNVLENLEWTSFRENIQHAHNTGLNETSRPVIKYALDGTQLTRYPSMAEAARNNGVSQEAVSGVCHRKKGCITSAGFIWRFASDPLDLGELRSLKPGRRPIIQYDLDGKKIAEYKSISEAGRATGADTGSLTRVCQARDGTSIGFQWRYKDDGYETLGKIRAGCEKPVKQFTRDGKYLRTWKSIAEAAKSLKIEDAHISGVCKGEPNRPTAGGYVWKYAEE
jgi:hypothetical protein